MKFLGMIAISACLAGAQNYSVQLPDSICLANTPVTWVKRIPQYCEGPVWQASTNSVYFTEQAGGANWPIWRVRMGVDTGAVFVASRQNNGLEFDPQDRLVAAQDGRVARLTATGALDSALVQSGQNGITFNQVNDLSIGSNGGIYFTTLAAQVYYLSPARVLSVAANGLSSANGIEWIEEQSAVFVNQAGGNQVTRYAVQGNGSLTGAAVFARLPVPDGGTVDAHGNRYIASYQQGEVRVFNAAGDSLGLIRLRFATGSYDARAGIQGNADNCVFGGPGNTTLFMTGDGGLYSIPLRIPGRSLPATPIRSKGVSPIRKAGPEGLFDILGRFFSTKFSLKKQPAFRSVPAS